MKPQHPNPKPQISLKSQFPNVQSGGYKVGFGDLSFELCMGFGAWDLGFTR